jgi:hypothetical protein
MEQEQEAKNRGSKGLGDVSGYLQVSEFVHKRI